MALTFTDHSIPLAVGHPLPSTRYHREDFNYGLRVYYDDTWDVDMLASRKFVLYFHGSTNTPTPLTGPLLDGLIAEGYVVACVLYFTGIAQSPKPLYAASPGPFRYGYGNVNAPHFTAAFIKYSWWVQSGVDWFKETYPSSAVVILGHSLGATSSICWSANLSGAKSPPLNLKGIVASGPTIGGLGTFAWNDMNRNISTMSSVIGLLKDDKVIIAHADNDSYGPPDYVKNIQQTVDPASETYFVSPGWFGHNWTNSTASAQFAVNWVRQLHNNSPILSRDGSRAVRGAVVN